MSILMEQHLRKVLIVQSLSDKMLTAFLASSNAARNHRSFIIHKFYNNYNKQN